MTENWYIILDLEFDPNPVVDEVAIADKIEEKRKFWSSKANDFNHGPKYRKYSQLLPDVKRDMLGETNIRTQLIKDACEKTYGPIDKQLKIMKLVEIPQDTVEKLAQKCKVDIGVVERRIAALGLKVIASRKADYEARYHKYYKNKPQNSDKYNGMKSSLEAFHVKNLYEFLYRNMNIKDAHNQPPGSLSERARELKKTEFYKHDPISGTGAKICGQCEEAFADENTKRIYDEYLAFNRSKRTLEDLKELYEISGEIGAESYTHILEGLTTIFKNRKEAEALLDAFCKIEKIPLPISRDSVHTDVSKVKVCRCGYTNNISDERTSCKNCGQELEIKCPKCQTMNDASVNICKCGFKLENIDKSVALCNLASIAMEAMDFTVAEAYLNDAEMFWPGSIKVRDLHKRLEVLQERLGTTVKDLRRACSEKKYFEAKKHLESVKKLAPQYSEPKIDEEIDHGIQRANDFKRKAQVGKSEAEILEACTKAYEASSDCPGIKEIIAKYPPLAPTNLEIITDANLRVNTLSWEKSPSEGLLYYSIIQKEGAIPRSIEDGIFIGRVSMLSISIHKVSSAVPYYYAVFAERVGIYSNAIMSKEETLNFFEVTGVNIVAGEGFIQINWEPIPENAMIKIQRITSQNEAVPLPCNSRNNFVDRHLSNDETYQYRVYLEYALGTKKKSTTGVYVSGTPTKALQPIKKISVKPKQENEFLIQWENPEESDVRFFYTTKKPELLCGDLVSMASIEGTMHALLLKKESKTEGSFKIEHDDLLYIIPVVEKSGSGVIGTITRASKGGSVVIKTASVVNGKIMIVIETSKDSIGFVVLYRHDQFPEDLSDLEASRKRVSIKEYQFNSGIFIDSNVPEKYYFSIFAERRRDGETDYSVGADYLFSNVTKNTITYSITKEKKLFSSQAKAIITFESDMNPFTLPGVDIMSAQDRPPMFKKSGKLFHKMDAQEVRGQLKISIPIEKGMPRVTYLKPFLEDENLAVQYVFKLKVGSNHKIN